MLIGDLAKRRLVFCSLRLYSSRIPCYNWLSSLYAISVRLNEHVKGLIIHALSPIPE